MFGSETADHAVLVDLLLTCVVVAGSGCLERTGTSTDAGCPGTGSLNIEVVESVPDNVTVHNVTGSVESDRLRSTLDRALRDGNPSVHELTAGETAGIDEDLRAAPMYNRPDAFGQYVRYDGSIVRIELLCDG